jgi:Asp-tRNA(Asn)/Glu-tRNA(Gln) amidotransferase C subunit
MSRARRWTVFTACVLLVNCSGSSENPLANGLTEEQQARLIEQSIAQIELTENFTPDNFEPLQRSHIETITEEMRDAALENLQRRLNKVMLLEMSQTVELDPESVEVDARMVDPKKAMVLVTVTGDRTYRTNNASKSSETRFVLPWVITVDGGELVFRHQGIRMRDLRN